MDREKQIRKYTKFFSGVQKKLTKFGLSMDNSALICDLVLALSNTPEKNKRKYKGVYERREGKNKKKYYSKITKDRKYYFLGNFSNAEEAANAYDAKCWELYCKKSKLNFKPGFS